MNPPENRTPRRHARARRALHAAATLLILPVRAAAMLLWIAVGLWASLAAYFALPAPSWVAATCGLAISAVFVCGLIERVPRNAPAGSWRGCRVKLSALGVAGLVAALFFAVVRPDPNWDWAPEHARQPRVTFDGDLARIENVRNFTWRSTTDADERWETRTYDLSKLTRMFYVVVPLGGFEGTAHVFVCFDFADGQHVAVSIEARRRRGDTYRLIPSMFRRYQIACVVGDERDVVGLRGKIRGSPVRFFPAATNPDRARAIFRSMIVHADGLNDRPEFYHLITNNCMTNITRHIRDLGGRPLPHDVALLLTGLSDRLAYQLGYIDTALPWDRAHEAFRVDDWMRTTELDEGFASRLRGVLKQREADAR
jgi:hypothetical protein